MIVERIASERGNYSTRRLLLRRLSSFPVMLASLLVLLSFVTVRGRLVDPDMWWHLKMGQIVWTTHVIPTTDVFSYTTGHHAWVPHEWLAQTLIYGAYRWAGYSGLMAWLCLFSAALLIVGYVLCTLSCGNSKVAFVGALVIWFFSTIGLAVRPQMVGYLLLTLELVLLYWGRTRNPLWFLSLPPLFGLWVNCHGSFFLGLIVAGVFLFCSFLDFEAGLLVSTRWERRPQIFLGVGLALSLGAIFLNPLGLKQVLYPLDTLRNQGVSLHFVEEWGPLDMTSARGIGLMVTLGCIFLVMVVRGKRLNLRDLLLVLLGTWLAVSHERMLFVFGILVAPVVSQMLADLWEGYDSERDNWAANAVMMAVSAGIVVWMFPNRQNLVRQVEEKTPVKAVQFLQNQHVAGRMLNEYNFGGYLIWALPESPVFMDGRADVYEWTGVMREFARWETFQEGPNLLLDKYRVDFCVLSQESSMARVLPLLRGWKRVYGDDMAVIFVRDAGAAKVGE